MEHEKNEAAVAAHVDQHGQFQSTVNSDNCKHEHDRERENIIHLWYH